MAFRRYSVSICKILDISDFCTLDTKEEVDMWVGALNHSKEYYENREREENHMKQLMEIGTGGI